MNPRRKFVRNPYLVIKDAGGFVSIQAPYFGTELRCRPIVRTLLDRFARPTAIGALDAMGVDEGVVRFLTDCFLLLPVDEQDLLSRGLLLQASRAAGAGSSWYELRAGDPTGGFVFFHVPVAFHEHRRAWTRRADGGERVRECLAAAFNNASHLIDFDRRRTVALTSLAFRDLGDVAFDSGYETLTEVGSRVRKIVRGVVEQNGRPIMVSGDHAMSFFAIDELLSMYDDIAVVHFDAHPDLYVVPDAAFNELTHANIFQHLRRRPNLRMVLQLGLRDFFAVPRGCQPVADDRFRYVSSHELGACDPAEIFRVVPRGLPVYLSFDVDVLDSAVAPDTGAPIPGGLDYKTAVALVDYAATHLNIVGSDFVELRDSEPHGDVTTQVVARLILTLTLARLPCEPLDAYVYQPGTK
jgi:arginase family enzyme